MAAAMYYCAPTRGFRAPGTREKGSSLVAELGLGHGVSLPSLCRSRSSIRSSSFGLGRPPFPSISPSPPPAPSGPRGPAPFAAVSVATGAEEPRQDVQVESEQFDWLDSWYPVFFTDDLLEDEPNPISIMGEPIVVWKDGEGVWRAFRDACPHRLVPLSEGRIDENGQLECPYHGWTFEGGGGCTAMPEGGDPSLPKACAWTYPCEVRQGMLFVRPTPLPRGKEHEAVDTSGLDAQLLPELEEEDAVSMDICRDFPYDVSLLLENLLDVGHVHFTHHGTISRRDKAPVINLRIDSRTDEGFTGVNLDGSMGARTTLFQAPGFMRHTIDNWEEKGRTMVITVYAVPVAPGRCRLLNRQVFRFKKKMPRTIIGNLPKWLFHKGNNVILDDDVIFLHRQMPEFVRQGSTRKPIGQVYTMPTSSDCFVVAFHEWLERRAGGGPFGPMDEAWLARTPKQMPRDELLDRYHSHTEHCRSCRTHLGRLEGLRAACAAVGAAAAVLGCLATSLAGAVAAAGLALAHPAAASPAVVQWAAGHVGAGRALGWGVGLLAVSVLCALGYWKSGAEARHYRKGDWPPPRNVLA